MKEAWNPQEAEARLSEPVAATLKGEPQTVARRGEQAVQEVSFQESVPLTQAETGLDAALAEAPEELPFERDRTPVPTVTLD